MKKNIYIAVFVAAAFVLGYSVNNIAISDTTPKVAVIDATKIVANSSAVKALKAEQEKKVKDIQATLEKAKAEISKETDPAKIAAIEEKYRTQINNQKIALDTEYNQKLTKIDNEIRATVVEKARNLNYDLVLPKNIVYFGGDDITDVIAKDIK
ncbi:MAG: OmpH family outer membrane protein [Brachyspira sp.]|nr:OmpH family outer membrane protein [Brachyspira sp.]CCY23680.1 outer membrane protein [Brachyspira sp. CAG:484]